LDISVCGGGQRGKLVLVLVLVLVRVRVTCRAGAAAMNYAAHLILRLLRRAAKAAQLVCCTNAWLVQLE
jgi:hypothetical protein